MTSQSQFPLLNHQTRKVQNSRLETNLLPDYEPSVGTVIDALRSYWAGRRAIQSKWPK